MITAGRTDDKGVGLLIRPVGHVFRPDIAGKHLAAGHLGDAVKTETHFTLRKLPRLIGRRQYATLEEGAESIAAQRSEVGSYARNSASFEKGASG